MLQNQGRRASLLCGWIGLLLTVGCTESTLVDAPPPPEQPPPACSSISIWKGHKAAFTFTTDDGENANRAWADVMQRRGYRFTLFVVPRWVGRSGHLSLPRLRDLFGRGFEIGGHGLSHTSLVSADDATLERELRVCRDTLRVLLGGDERVARTFAYPYHSHDARVMAAAARFYFAARDGGLNPQGRPNFSLGVARWDSLSLFEVPMRITITSLVERNTLSETETRTRVRQNLPGWKDGKHWVVVMAHTSADCDPTHLEWIIDELERDGDIWIAPFHDVVAYRQRAVACRQDTLAVPVLRFSAAGSSIRR